MSGMQSDFDFADMNGERFFSLTHYRSVHSAPAAANSDVSALSPRRLISDPGTIVLLINTRPDFTASVTSH